MGILSFTGPSRLTLTQEVWAKQELEPYVFGFDARSGGAYGIDTLVAVTFPAADVTLVLPKNKWFNEGLLIEPGWQAIEWIEGGYRARNEALVKGSNVLHAFLKQSTFYRSGEWMTVNIARRAGVPVIKHILPS